MVKKTAAQAKALKAYNFALAQEDRYLDSVFVTAQGQARVEAATKAAYEEAGVKPAFSRLMSGGDQYLAATGPPQPNR